jgi:cell division protein FtsB
MPTPIPSAPLRRDTRPEPLRRKRVLPPPSSSTPRRRKVLNGLLAFATVVLFVDALIGDKGLVERMRARRQYAEQAAALAAIRHENAVMRDKIVRLKNDPSTIESLAREEMGLIRPGELLFILRDAARPASHKTEHD